MTKHENTRDKPASSHPEYEYDDHHQPLLTHDLIRGAVSRETPAWFPLPPLPVHYSPSRLTFTREQYALLQWLDSWHWRFSPSVRELAKGIGRDVKSVHLSLIGLRRLGLLDWVDRQERTLHFTPLGQTVLRLHVGPTRLPDSEGLRAYNQAQSEYQGEAYGFQKYAARRRNRIYRQTRHRHPVPPSMMRYTQTGYRPGARILLLHRCSDPHEVVMPPTPEEFV